MKIQDKSSITKNHKKKNYGVPFKGYLASKVIFRFCTRNKKKDIVDKSSDLGRLIP